jgi:hypothetical protein
LQVVVAEHHGGVHCRQLAPGISQGSL